MEIQVELTEQDHTDFYKDYGLKRNAIAKALIMLLIDLLVCVCLNALLLRLIIVIAILLFPFFFVIPYFISRSKFKRAYNYDASPVATRIYKPFAIGIEISQRGSEGFLRYEHIRKVGKAGRYIYLILSDGKYFLLPDWCFSSYEEIDHFLKLVRSGMATAKGVTPKAPLTFKPVHLVGILCLVPLLGAFAGIVLIILGLTHYKDRVFIVMGAIGVAITVSIYGSLIFFTMNSGAVKNGFAELTQTEVNDLVKTIEFFKVQNGQYPDSLQQLDIKGGSFVSIYDTMNDLKPGSKAAPYQYHKLGKKYLLFSVGVDGKPNTKDDIYPNLMVADTSKVGFISKPVY